MSELSLRLTLFVGSRTPETDALIAELEHNLENYYKEQYELSVVNVIAMPEKAAEMDVFVTPTLIRNMPEPVMKVIGSLAKMRNLLASITANDANISQTIVV